VNKLTITAQGDQEIVMRREFNAPRALVFDAYTKPEHLRRWLGVMPGFTFAVCEVDLRVGGKYRWEWHGPNNFKMGMGGVYKEVQVPERLVTTERYDESWYPGDGLHTITFVEKAGRTTVTTTLRYESKDARDAVLKSPMEEGVSAGYDNLEKLLPTL
jgi:uncharacterized protein YndB with AHSA1/START domain